jgi:PAS domain S-box-containing protein
VCSCETHLKEKFLRQNQRSLRAGGAAQFIGLLIVLAAILLSPQVSSAAPVKPVRRVLIFYELGLSSPCVSILDQQIRAVLENSPFQVELYREYLETTLFPDPKTQKEMRDWYIRKYQHREPDVIITLGPSPLRFLIDSHQEPFKDVPVVFGGHLELEAGFHESLRSYESSLDIHYITDLPMPQLLDTLSHLPPNTVVLLTHIGLDAAGTRFIGASQADPMVTKASNAPVFGPSDVDLGHGEVGGYLDSFALQGRVMGEMATRILKGESPKDIPVVTGADAYMFDWRALRRWRFSESCLPPGSSVLNREPTLWSSYEWYIVAGICLFLAQTSLILALLWQRATRRNAEAALRESEGRFRQVANTAPVMIWMSGPDRMCNYFNKPWLDFTGRSLEQELGKRWAEGVHTEDLDLCLKTYTEAFDRKEQFEMQYRLRRHDGEYRWLLDIGVPRFNHDGSLAGFIGSCLDVTERKRAEETLSTIGRRLIEAHEEERTWIGRELHDDINQRLALLAVELGQWSEKESRAKFSEHLSHALTRIMEISVDVQALSHRLHSSKLDYLGLATAARGFCKEVADKAKVDVQFNHSAVPSTIPKEVSLCLFRVLQEALQNSIKYSAARTFKVDLRGISGGIELVVSDDGKGFDEQEVLSHHGLGLISMRERMQMVDGVLNVKTAPGVGTTISARVPLELAERRAKAG